jgi:hypothetical protein
MKAFLRELIAPAETKLLAIHFVREYLQARILQSLQRAGAMQTLAFYGGTSLRFLYDIPRYSEDLDFALELHPESYDFRAYLQHHDPATLLAGKLCAILQREYTKGRDIYDLWWYLNQSEWPTPNLAYLNQCLQQGGRINDELAPGDWQMVVRENLLPLNWPLVMEDVGSFIINLNEHTDFNQEKLLALLD